MAAGAGGDPEQPQAGPASTYVSTYEAGGLAGPGSAGLCWSNLTMLPELAVSCSGSVGPFNMAAARLHGNF